MGHHSISGSGNTLSELGHYVVGRRSQTGVQMPALQHQVIARGEMESVAGGGSKVSIQSRWTTLRLLHTIPRLQELNEWLVRCPEVEFRVGGVAWESHKMSLRRRK